MGEERGFIKDKCVFFNVFFILLYLSYDGLGVSQCTVLVREHRYCTLPMEHTVLYHN